MSDELFKRVQNNAEALKQKQKNQPTTAVATTTPARRLPPRGASLDKKEDEYAEARHIPDLSSGTAERQKRPPSLHRTQPKPEAPKEHLVSPTMPQPTPPTMQPYDDASSLAHTVGALNMGNTTTNPWGAQEPAAGSTSGPYDSVSHLSMNQGPGPTSGPYDSASHLSTSQEPAAGPTSGPYNSAPDPNMSQGSAAELDSGPYNRTSHPGQEAAVNSPYSQVVEFQASVLAGDVSAANPPATGPYSSLSRDSSASQAGEYSLSGPGTGPYSSLARRGSQDAGTGIPAAGPYSNLHRRGSADSGPPIFQMGPSVSSGPYNTLTHSASQDGGMGNVANSESGLNSSTAPSTDFTNAPEGNLTGPSTPYQNVASPPSGSTPYQNVTSPPGTNTPYQNVPAAGDQPPARPAKPPTMSQPLSTVKESVSNPFDDYERYQKEQSEAKNNLAPTNEDDEAFFDYEFGKDMPRPNMDVLGGTPGGAATAGANHLRHEEVEGRERAGRLTPEQYDEVGEVERVEAVPEDYDEVAAEGRIQDMTEYDEVTEERRAAGMSGPYQK